MSMGMGMDMGMDMMDVDVSNYPTTVKQEAIDLLILHPRTSASTSASASIRFSSPALFFFFLFFSLFFLEECRARRP
jgi:hypothetical protein